MAITLEYHPYLPFAKTFTTGVDLTSATLLAHFRRMVTDTNIELVASTINKRIEILDEKAGIWRFNLSKIDVAYLTKGVFDVQLTMPNGELAPKLFYGNYTPVLTVTRPEGVPLVYNGGGRPTRTTLNGTTGLAGSWQLLMGHNPDRMIYFLQNPETNQNVLEVGNGLTAIAQITPGWFFQEGVPGYVWTGSVYVRSIGTDNLPFIAWEL